MEYKENKLKRSGRQELDKIRQWCAYQERSHHETRYKLKALGMSSEEIELSLAVLISENFLNEERFALAFSGGKFRMKGWGRVKIKSELRKHMVSEINIEKAISSIEADEYFKSLDKILNKKIASMRSKSIQQISASAYRYMMSKGFESELVIQALKQHKLQYES